MLNAHPQNISFQIPSKSNIERTHIRLWDFAQMNGKKVYLATISDDTELELVLYNYFLAPLHDINPDIDTARDSFIDAF